MHEKRIALQRLFWESPRDWGQFCRVESRGAGAYRLADFQASWIDLVDGNSTAMIIAPRGFLKSTIINDYILRDVL